MFVGLGLATCLIAQDVDSRLSLSIGVNRPTSSSFRSQTGDLGYGLAVDYSLGRRCRIEPSVELGFSRVGGTQHVDTFSLLVVGRMLLPKSRVYGLVGLGGFRHSARSGHDSLNKIGGMLGFGTELSQNFAAEFTYRVSGSYLGASSDAMTLRGRFRF